MLPKDRTGICLSELARWNLLTLERRMVSCGPKTVVGISSTEKKRKENEDSNYSPPLRQFCCRGKQRSEAAAGEGPGV